MKLDKFYTIFNSMKKDLHSHIYRCGVFSSPVTILEFCEKLFKCLYSDEFYDAIDMTPILLELKDYKKIKNEKLLNPINFNSLLKSGETKKNNLIKVDLNGHQREKGPYPIIIEHEQEVMDYSVNKLQCIYLFIAGYKLIVVYNGDIKWYCPNISSLKTRGKIEKSLPVSQYKRLINRHFKDCLDGEREASYWKTKRDWKLKASPEIIFQKSLAAYLNNFVLDGHVIEECLNVNTTDRTDITILTYELKKYILEVKWIGKSVSSSYDGKEAHKRSNSGINQLLIYLNRDRNAICGHLVVYDARKAKVKIKWENAEKWDVRIDRQPSVIPLHVESASKKAKK